MNRRRPYLRHHSHTPLSLTERMAATGSFIEYRRAQGDDDKKIAMTLRIPVVHLVFYTDLLYSLTRRDWPLAQPGVVATLRTLYEPQDDSPAGETPTSPSRAG